MYLDTCKCCYSSLNVVAIVALDATEMLSKNKRWSGNENNPCEGEDSEDTVPNSTSLLQKDPR